MGAWGTGIWENDAALDELYHLCEKLMARASEHLKISNDPVQFDETLAWVDSVRALCENAKSHGGLDEAKLGAQKQAALDTWRGLQTSTWSKEDRLERLYQIESTFDKLISVVADHTA